jgi:integrase
MATVNFLIKGTTDLCSIYIRVKDGRQIDFTVKTELVVNKTFWSAKTGTISQKAEFKDKLNLSRKLTKLKTLVSEEIQNLKVNNKDLTKEWVETIVSRFNGKGGNESSQLICLLENKIIEFNNRAKKVSISSTKCYKTTIQRLEKFESYKKKVFDIKDVDLQFHTDYTKYCKNELSLSVNSISKDLKQLKTVATDAKEQGFEINEQVLSKRFNAPTEKTDFITLTEKEIDLIKGFTGPNYLENARDWLIVGCWTGCRINDLIKLDTTKVLTGPNELKYIQYTQSKTGKTVNIPLHPHVKEIMKRLEGFPRPITDVNFNKYIKLVCESVGITEPVFGSKMNTETKRKESGMFPKYQLVRSHTCRRSFATIHYSKLSNKTIMAVTGHTTERQFLEYIGQQENDHINEFVDLWGTVKTLN